MSSGSVAFERLKKLAQPAEFKAVIQKLNFGRDEGDNYDTRSCAMNNTAIVKTLTNQPIAASIFASQLSGMKALGVNQGQSGVLTKEVMKTLQKPTIVSFSLKFAKGNTGGGDHYFSVFALDGSTIVAAMGWQGLYDLTEYFEGNDGGKFARGKFEGLLGQIEAGDINGVTGLCSYLGQTREGKSIPATLNNDIGGFKPVIQPVYYFDLPNG